MTEVFPPRGEVLAPMRCLRLAAQVCEHYGGADAVILDFGGPVVGETSPWFCFDVKLVNSRERFAIWIRTGKLYRVDESGAVEDEPIDVGDLGS